MTIEAMPWIQALPPYIPGVKAADASGSLAANESALGASPAVIELIPSLGDTVHRYPDPLARNLRRGIAEHHGVKESQVLVGNGSDELIYLIALAYLAKDRAALCASPAYRIDEISSRVVNADVVSVPLRNWAHDLDEMAKCEASVAYVVNPHNPTGTTKTFDEISRFVESCKSRIVIVDEAYIDYNTDPAVSTAVPLVDTGKVLVLRTFSKIFGLAGLRVGYLIGPEHIISVLQAVRAPFSVNVVAQEAALRALEDRAHWERVRNYTVGCREQLREALLSAGFEPVPSQANFMLVPTDDEPGMVDHFRDAGITVRPGSALGVESSVRISVPDETGMAMVHRALEDLKRPSSIGPMDAAGSVVAAQD